MAEYLQRGEALDYTNATDNLIPHDTVVALKDRIGVTGCPIPPGKTGSLHMIGVFETVATETVYFDGTGITDVVGEGSIKAGYAAAPADAAGASVLVSING